MFATATVLVVLAMVPVVARAVRGPTLYDRVLAVNLHGTMTVLLIALIGMLAGRADFLDLALAYALLNFVGTLAVLKYVGHGTLGEAP